MKKYMRPILNQLHQSINWLYSLAPTTFVWIIGFIVFATLLTTCSCTNPLIPEPLPTEQVITSLDTIHLIPIEKAGMKLCSCDGGIAGGETVGVICSNGQFLFLGQHLGNHCMCGNFYVKYWVCKRKKSEI